MGSLACQCCQEHFGVLALATMWTAQVSAPWERIIREFPQPFTQVDQLLSLFCSELCHHPLPLMSLLKHDNHPWTDTTTTHGLTPPPQHSSTSKVMRCHTPCAPHTPCASHLWCTDMHHDRRLECGCGATIILYGVLFVSKALKPGETRYSKFNRDLLAIYLAVRYFLGRKKCPHELQTTGVHTLCLLRYPAYH